jgi:transposase
MAVKFIFKGKDKKLAETSKVSTPTVILRPRRPKRLKELIPRDLREEGSNRSPRTNYEGVKLLTASEELSEDLTKRTIRGVNTRKMTALIAAKEGSTNGVKVNPSEVEPVLHYEGLDLALIEYPVDALSDDDCVMTPEEKAKYLGYRPTKLTPEVFQAIQIGMLKGMSLASASKLIGINPQTIYKWYTAGRGDASNYKYREPFISFTAMVDQARSIVEMGLVNKWRDVAMRSPEHHAAKDFLKAQYPEDWNPTAKQNVTVSGPNEGPITFLAIQESQNSGQLSSDLDKAKAQLDDIVLEAEFTEVSPEMEKKALPPPNLPTWAEKDKHLKEQQKEYKERTKEYLKQERESYKAPVGDDPSYPKASGYKKKFKFRTSKSKNDSAPQVAAFMAQELMAETEG